MNYLCCIDDTDMPGTRGTGWLVQDLCAELEKEIPCTCSAISRHQLFVHDEIPFTSHNSAMCFEMNLADNCVSSTLDRVCTFVKTRSQHGSDPGICFAELDDTLDVAPLVDFGIRAKTEVLSKASAYFLAEKCHIHLSEHGGTGQGVVGAVAGVGLRLSQDDGRYRGWFTLGKTGEVVSVDHLIQYPFIDQVLTVSGEKLPGNARICIGSEKTKTVRLHGKQVVVALEDRAFANKTGYRTITKEEAKQY